MEQICAVSLAHMSKDAVVVIHILINEEITQIIIDILFSINGHK